MGVPGRADYTAVAPALPPVVAEDGPREALLAEAVRARPELASQRLSVAAQDHAVSAAERWLLPSFSLGAGTSAFGGGPLGADPFRPAYAGSVDLRLSWNLFDGLASPAQADAERARLDAARANLTDLEQRVFQEVENAAGAVASARAELPAAEEALEAAKELLGLAEARYREGVGTSLELADAELELATAAAERVRVGYDLAGARAQLLRALGREEWR
jgi:outer membrane protein TolC